ncbi:Uncharacterised protein [Bacillus subtilis]|nr:Uncharacterised protein [Bacillus subtilis]
MMDSMIIGKYVPGLHLCTGLTQNKTDHDLFICLHCILSQ